jgi:hypothetical protein
VRQPRHYSISKAAAPKLQYIYSCGFNTIVYKSCASDTTVYLKRQPRHYSIFKAAAPTLQYTVSKTEALALPNISAPTKDADPQIPNYSAPELGQKIRHHQKIGELRQPNTCGSDTIPSYLAPTLPKHAEPPVPSDAAPAPPKDRSPPKDAKPHLPKAADLRLPKAATRCYTRTAAAPALR